MTNQDLLLADFISSGPQYFAMISSEPYFFFSSRAAKSGRKVKSPIKPASLTTMVFHFQTFFLYFFLSFSFMHSYYFFCMTCWLCSSVFTSTQLSSPFWGSTKHRQAPHHFDIRLFTLSSFVALKILQTTLSYLKGWADLSSNFLLKHKIKHVFYPLLLLAKAT